MKVKLFFKQHYVIKFKGKSLLLILEISFRNIPLKIRITPSSMRQCLIEGELD